MYDFSKVTEVRLASGSHSSPADGMCFMEMTAWFAGEKHTDKPDCACPVLAAYGIALNDRMPDDLRDELLKPLVPMIAGTRGTLDDQRRRAEFFAIWSIKMILPIALRAAKLETHAVACEAAVDLTAAKAAAYAAKAAAYAAAYAADAAYAAYAAAAYAADAAYAYADAADAADAAYAAYAYADAREVFTIGVEGLRQAILIGPHEGLDLAIDIASRHAALRELVAA